MTTGFGLNAVVVSVEAPGTIVTSEAFGEGFTELLVLLLQLPARIASTASRVRRFGMHDSLVVRPDMKQAL
jgi:hypothetical protein